MKEFDTIKMVFSRVSERESIDPEQFRLDFHGKMLTSSTKTLRDYNISSNSTLTMIFRLKGGSFALS
jgi:hypothetical protein